ncbi:MAG: hypothetical protein IKZ98_02700 [Clostridia bacterium]|nr:hypothetical protein [Clostridia bacterium]
MTFLRSIVLFLCGVISFALKLEGAHFLWHFLAFFGAIVEDGGFLYYGEVIGTDDLITFGGKTPEEAEQDFHDAIDEFLGE